MSLAIDGGGGGGFYAMSLPPELRQGDGGGGGSGDANSSPSGDVPAFGGLPGSVTGTDPFSGGYGPDNEQGGDGTNQTTPDDRQSLPEQAQNQTENQTRNRFQNINDIVTNPDFINDSPPGSDRGDNDSPQGSDDSSTGSPNDSPSGDAPLFGGSPGGSPYTYGDNGEDVVVNRPDYLHDGLVGDDDSTSGAGPNPMWPNGGPDQTEQRDTSGEDGPDTPTTPPEQMDEALNYIQNSPNGGMDTMALALGGVAALAIGGYFLL